MAAYAIEAGMGSGQRELSLRMIEGRWDPPCGRVAARAVGIEIILHMVWVLDGIVVILVAGEAVSRSPRKLPIGVARFAGQSQMDSGQRKRSLIMIELRRDPGYLPVANCAILRKIAANVVRLGDILVILLVTSETFARKIQLVINVAIDT